MDALLDDKRLTGNSLRLLMTLLDTRTRCHGWTQPRLAELLEIPVSSLRTAFTRLRSLGYLRYEKRSAGNRDFDLHWYFVTDAPEEFGDVEAFISAAVARKARASASGSTRTITSVFIENDHVSSGAVDQQLTSPAEPPSLGGGNKSFTPLPPGVDGSPSEGVGSAGRSRSRSRVVERMREQRRGSLARARLKPPGLVHPELGPWWSRAELLARSLGVPSWMVPQVAGHLAVCLRSGDDEASLRKLLRTNTNAVDCVEYVMRYRAELRASRKDAGLAGLVSESARVQRAAWSARKAARAGREREGAGVGPVRD